MPLYVLSSAESPPGAVASDHLIPLSIAWPVVLDDAPLYLFVSDPRGGYVELKVDADTGALVGLVVIDLPSMIEREIPSEEAESTPGVPVLDVSLWPWRVTPDDREPLRRDIDLKQGLAYTLTADLCIVWFSRAVVDRFLVSGEVRVGISSADELVLVSTPRLAGGADRERVMQG